MRKLLLLLGCLIMVLAIMRNESHAQLSEPSFELEKVIGNVYVGKQGAPLDPIMGTGPGTYLTMNLYVITSDDRKELALIDVPGLQEDAYPLLLQLFLQSLKDEFPEAEIKGVFLTHDHIDHCWSIGYFLGKGIPVYASSAEINYPVLGSYDVPLAWFPTIIPIEPGDSVSLGDGETITAVDLTGHTPGHLGYAYYPDDGGGKINWFFAGDAVMAPQDHGASPDPFDITYLVRQRVLAEDTYDREIWMEKLVELQGMLTKHAKLFPGHGAVREGYLWQNPAAYIDHTVTVLQAVSLVE